MKTSGCSRITIVFTLMTILYPAGSVFADNQIIPGNMGTADPAPMVDGDTLYLYTTTDAIGNGDLSIYDIRCWSTTDLYHWNDCGVVLNENDVPWAAKLGNLWAPHCIKLGGKYHLYFPAEAGGSVEVREGSSTGVLLGTVVVPSTGGLTVWKTVTASLTQEGLALTGVHDIVLVFSTTVSNQYNVNWVSIGKRATTANVPESSFRESPFSLDVPAQKRSTVKLYLQSGKIPISEGVMFDFSGRVLHPRNMDRRYGIGSYAVVRQPEERQ